MVDVKIGHFWSILRRRSREWRAFDVPLEIKSGPIDSKMVQCDAQYTSILFKTDTGPLSAVLRFTEPIPWHLLFSTGKNSRNTYLPITPAISALNTSNMAHLEDNGLPRLIVEEIWPKSALPRFPMPKSHFHKNIKSNVFISFFWHF